MSPRIETIRINHLNMVLEDYDTSVGHFQSLFGAEFLLDLPQPTWHACLLGIGRVIFELFAPHEFFLHTRYGPHYIGIEYQVTDFELAREVIAREGIRVARDLGVAVHTHPADCHGVSLELYGGYFHDNPDALRGATMRPAEYWRDEHPLGLLGLKSYAVAVTDLEQARADFQAVFHNEVVYEAARPALAGTAVGLQIADAVLELVAPVGDGALHDHLLAHGEGIRSTTFAVRDLTAVAGYFAARDITLVPGSTPGALALPAGLNRGVLFEFSE